MKIKGFFTALVSQILAGLTRPPTAQKVAELKRELLANKELLQGAQQLAVSRRHAQHRRTCESAYRAKLAKVTAGKGRHTDAGIPRTFVAVNGKEIV